MAELGSLGNNFLGIGIFTTMMSLRNNQSYGLNKGAIFNIIDMAAWVGGVALGAAMISAGLGLLPILTGGVAIGVAANGLKSFANYAVDKWIKQ